MVGKQDFLPGTVDSVIVLDLVSFFRPYLFSSSWCGHTSFALT